jgi:hypothetical protein
VDGFVLSSTMSNAKMASWLLIVIAEFRCVKEM